MPCFYLITYISGGKTLILRSSIEGVRFGFCHLSSVEVMVGSAVAKGRMVARSGNTGRSMGPHLHFSVKRGGAWGDSGYDGGEFVDPAPYLEIRS